MIRWMTVTMAFPLIYFHWTVHIFSLALTFNEGLAFFLDVSLSVFSSKSDGLVDIRYICGHWWLQPQRPEIMEDDGWSTELPGILAPVPTGSMTMIGTPKSQPSSKHHRCFWPQFCLFFCLLRWLGVYSIESICGQLHTVDHVFSSWPGLEAKQANGLATHSCEHCCCSKVLDNILYVNLEWGNFGFSRSQSMATLDELDSEHKHRWRSIYACSTRAVTLMPMLRLVLLKKLRR